MAERVSSLEGKTIQSSNQLSSGFLFQNPPTRDRLPEKNACSKFRSDPNFMAYEIIPPVTGYIKIPSLLILVPKIHEHIAGL